jgi:hypothetical protein
MEEDVQDDDDDDPVVREFDVYLSPEFAGQMYLLQYPLVLQHHPETATTNNNDIEDDWLQPPPLRARIKPRHNLFTEDHVIPVHGLGGGDGGYAGMSHRTFESQTIPIDTHLCIGKIVSPSTSDDDHDPIIHLVPLTHIYQMRPSFRHVDDSDMSPHKNHAVDMMGEDHPFHNDTAEEDADEEYHPGGATAAATANKSPVMFQRKESERSVLARQSSYAFKKSSEDSEPWQDLDVIVPTTGGDDKNNHGGPVITDTTVSWNQRRILNAVPESIWASSTTSGTSYIQSLNYYHDQRPIKHPPPLTSTGTDQKVPYRTKNDDDLQHWVSRLSSMLQSGYPVPYSILKWQLLQQQQQPNVPTTTPGTRGTSTDDVLPDDVLFLALSSCAVLCRGNWCLHSRFVFSTPPHQQQHQLPPFSSSSSSSKSTVGFVLLQRLRTLILLILQDHGIVYRPPLSRVVQYWAQPQPIGTTTTSTATDLEDHTHVLPASVLSPEQVAFVLSMVAKPSRPTKGGGGGWIFKVEDNDIFLKTHPSVVQQHAEYWNRQRHRFRTELELYHLSAAAETIPSKDEILEE